MGAPAFDTWGYTFIEDAELGGNDQLWGGDNVLSTQLLVGGPYNDKIWSGSDAAGAITIYGDKNNPSKGTTLNSMTTPDSNLTQDMPLNE